MNIIRSFTVIGLTLGLVLCLPILGQAEESFATIVLEKSVHFSAPDGDDLLVPAGMYAVAGDGERIRFTQEKESSPRIIEAQRDSHDQTIDLPMAVTISGEGEDADTIFVGLLMPDRTSLEATGSYSGVRGRGFRDSAEQFREKAKRSIAKALQEAKENAERRKRMRDARRRQRQAY